MYGSGCVISRSLSSPFLMSRSMAARPVCRTAPSPQSELCATSYKTVTSASSVKSLRSVEEPSAYHGGVLCELSSYTLHLEKQRQVSFACLPWSALNAPSEQQRAFDKHQGEQGSLHLSVEDLSAYRPGQAGLQGVPIQPASTKRSLFGRSQSREQCTSTWRD